MSKDTFAFKYFRVLPAALPAYFIPEPHPFYSTRLTMEKLAEHCWQIYYARHYESLAFGAPEIVSGTLRVGRHPEECEKELLKVLNHFPMLTEGFYHKLRTGILTFRIKEKDWLQSELLHRDYHDIEIAALYQLGVSNELLRWMYRERKFILHELKDQPLLAEEVRIREMEFTISDQVLRKFRKSQK
ncbi:MAG: hypothetical protein ACLFT3_05535 [Cyclobacteriaceae bacterium]